MKVFFLHMAGNHNCIQERSLLDLCCWFWKPIFGRKMHRYLYLPGIALNPIALEKEGTTRWIYFL